MTHLIISVRQTWYQFDVVGVVSKEVDSRDAEMSSRGQKPPDLPKYIKYQYFGSASAWETPMIA